MTPHGSTWKNPQHWSTQAQSSPRKECPTGLQCMNGACRRPAAENAQWPVITEVMDNSLWFLADFGFEGQGLGSNLASLWWLGDWYGVWWDSWSTCFQFILWNVHGQHRLILFRLGAPTIMPGRCLRKAEKREMESEMRYFKEVRSLGQHGYSSC